MNVPVDASNELPPQIEPPNVLSVVALKVIDDSRNAKPEDPSPKVGIHSGDMKVEDAPLVIIPQVIVVFIDHWVQFTTKQKFDTQNDLLEWVREEARKLGFSIVIGKSDKGCNRRNAFVIVICEKEGSCTG
jgi:hypothetical protein